MKNFIVDSSVAIKWFVPEVHWMQASRLADPEFALHAPELIVVEIGNALWKKIRRQELSRAQAEKILEAIKELKVELIPSPELLQPAVDLAVLLNHPVYDCFYLAAAVQRNAWVVTADARFHRAVRSSALAFHIRWIEDEL